MTNRAYRFRIYPDKSQRILFAKTFGCCRFLYNQMLADKKAEYEQTGKMRRITPAAYKKDHPWLKEVDSLALANVQLHLEGAFRRFFEVKGSGYPKFRSKHRSERSYTTSLVNNNIRIEKSRLKLPKAGWVKIRQHREIPDGYMLKSVTVRMEPSGKYYAALLFEIPDHENQGSGIAPEEAEILGIDFAMQGMAVFSDGSRADYPMFMKQSLDKLARAQRKLSRCEKGSHNYRKQKRKVARCHEKVRNQRKDFQHKLSRKIADTYDAVAVEDINMKAMSMGLKLGKGVMDNSYSSFRKMLAYKLEERGKQLIYVGRFFPSSKRCSRCGRVKKELRLDEREYRCMCGNCMDRDINAAVNIREEGRRLMAAS